MKTLHYYKRRWEECTGEEETESWGFSMYYFETDDNFHVLRQMQLFDNGKILKYDTLYWGDKYGGLATHALEEDFGDDAIDQEEFNEVWESNYYKRFPEIVCTNDVLGGAPRLEGRRLSVGDIVSILDMNEFDVAIKDFDLSLLDVK